MQRAPWLTLLSSRLIKHTRTWATPCGYRANCAIVAVNLGSMKLIRSVFNIAVRDQTSSSSIAGLLVGWSVGRSVGLVRGPGTDLADRGLEINPLWRAVRATFFDSSLRDRASDHINNWWILAPRSGRQITPLAPSLTLATFSAGCRQTLWLRKQSRYLWSHWWARNRSNESATVTQALQLAAPWRWVGSKLQRPALVSDVYILNIVDDWSTQKSLPTRCGRSRLGQIDPVERRTGSCTGWRSVYKVFITRVCSSSVFYVRGGGGSDLPTSSERDINHDDLTVLWPFDLCWPLKITDPLQAVTFNFIRRWGNIINIRHDNKNIVALLSCLQEVQGTDTGAL